MLWSREIHSKETIPLANVAWACICKRLRSPGIDSKEPFPLANVAWACICKRFRSPGIDSLEPILQANVAWAIFVNVYGAQESVPRNRFRQPMYPGEPVQLVGLSYQLARLGIDAGLLKRFTNTGSGGPVQ